ncbi:Pimeloyl-ACP methyl ester carboxylesterase [Faunimonas pinastri]|uniref:Pimeloyl-ACP methyl ester carboxylesterase n=1 Tax=Faunimonas pinastri TaxID=1855383 RepID=A0A1H9LEH8_9HYPH|nr:alpha/beta hydrolase [Faunimonas pinastri]SER09607.1 Pimeloyl-ACP methyl ester carboxylesterase [Faunimonas pinastri]
MGVRNTDGSDGLGAHHIEEDAMPSVGVTDIVIHVEELNTSASRSVVLLHGWPDDASTWDDVAPAIAAAGYRVIIPTLRGFGRSLFTDKAAPRTANPGIHAMDMIAVLDALAINKVAVVGHDWGSNIAEALAVGWPDRIERITMLATPPRLGGMPTPPFEQAQRYWYHWFMATERGAQAVRADPHGFAHLHWENWSPKGWFDEATFRKVAKSFDNPDWVDITLHSYRSRWEEAAPDPRSDWLETKIKAATKLSLPTLFIKGDEDGVTTQESFAKVPAKFGGPFEMVGLPGVGHFPQREAPGVVADLIIAFLADAPDEVRQP